VEGLVINMDMCLCLHNRRKTRTGDVWYDDSHDVPRCILRGGAKKGMRPQRDCKLLWVDTSLGIGDGEVVNCDSGLLFLYLSFLCSSAIYREA